MTEGHLAATILETIRLRDAQKAAGASQVELDANLEKTLRAAWPVTRAWHFWCERCSDYGLVIRECPGDSTCGRAKEGAKVHPEHVYAEPCFCHRGARFQPRQPTETSAIEAAAKVRKPTRWGR